MTSGRVPRVVAPLDALLLRGDGNPTTRAIMTAALVLDRPPGVDRLSEAFDRASRAVPRMRQTVVESTLFRGQAHWVTDDDFCVTDHVREIGAPGERSLGAVLQMAGASATAPFDPARPLWDASLVTGMADGSAVVLLRLHHAIADGVRVIHMMAHLLDLEPDPSRPDLPVLEQRGSTLARTSERLVGSATHTARVHRRRALGMAKATLRSAVDPIGLASDAVSWTRSAVRTFDSGGASASPLLARRSRARRFGVLEIELDQVRRCAKADGATVNDVYLSGLLGGLARYHDALGAAVCDVPISFPVDVSGDNQPETGNHFSAAVIAGPSSVVDPRERLRMVHQAVLSRRSESGLDAPVRLAPLLHQSPAWLTTAGVNAYARRVDLQASNIAGPDCALYLAGSRINRFYAFGPLPGVPVMSVLVSHEGRCTIGLTIDPAAVTDPELLVASIQAAFDELLAAGPPAPDSI